MDNGISKITWAAMGLWMCSAGVSAATDTAAGANGLEDWEQDVASAPVNDPLEGMNRAVYRFNEEVDRYVVKPVAQGYDAALPQPAKRGVSNFFDNAYTPVVILNCFLQGKPREGVEGFTRMLVNSTVGLGGLVDVASNMEDPLVARSEDFGQTLAVWGVGEGPYLVLPFFGPSNVRDALGLIPDYFAQPINHIENEYAYWSLTALDAVDSRYRLLEAGAVLDEAALDPYAFVREAYRQNRTRLIEDRDAPPVPGAGNFGTH